MPFQIGLTLLSHLHHALVIGGVVLVMIVVCVCLFLRKQQRRQRLDTMTSSAGSIRRRMQSSVTQISMNNLYSTSIDSSATAFRFASMSEKMPGEQQRMISSGTESSERSVRLSDAGVMASWLSVAAAGSNPMFDSGNGAEGLFDLEALQGRESFASGSVGFFGSADSSSLVSVGHRGSVLTVMDNPLLAGGGAARKASHNTINPLSALSQVRHGAKLQIRV